MREAPRVVGHERLSRAVWGGEGGDAAALHTHIYALRAAVDRPFSQALIQSVHGIGYRFGAGG
jgi:DNA-binding winged helix-turn-helix (wHTH) protein